MSKLLQTVLFVPALTLVLEGGASASTAPVEIATDRCNSQTIDEASARVRDYDRHAPGGGSAQLLERYGALAEVLSVINEESEILSTVCSSDAQRADFATQIAGTTAWALALEADVAGRLNASCSAAAQALPTMMLADAWLALAKVVNDDGGVVPASFHDVIPRVQTRAQAVGLELPAWPDTSAYWRDQVHVKAKKAIATCPSPSPSPSAAPT